LTESPSGRIRPPRSESLTRCASVPWGLNDPFDVWHKVVPALNLDGVLVSTCGHLQSGHAHNSFLASNNYQCIIGCCTLMDRILLALHCSAHFHDSIAAEPVASQVSSSAAAATSMSPQLFVLFPLLCYNIYL